LELERQGRLEAAGKRHLFAIAAYLMRQILVQNARKRAAQKRGGGGVAVPLGEVVLDGPVEWEEEPETMLALNDALVRLGEFDAVKASIVEMRFFADLSIEDTARALEISPTTVKRHWAVARVWLYEQLRAR
jgi:RNA polymerase sigma factor (TIGR02999 family)